MKRKKYDVQAFGVVGQESVQGRAALGVDAAEDTAQAPPPLSKGSLLG
jgi:hypothetical protein